MSQCHNNEFFALPYASTDWAGQVPDVGVAKKCCKQVETNVICTHALTYTLTYTNDNVPCCVMTFFEFLS